MTAAFAFGSGRGFRFALAGAAGFDERAMLFL
jgi:hypothetical protein